MRCIKLTTVILIAGCYSDAVLASDWYIEKRLSTSASFRFEGSNKLTSQVNSFRLKAEYRGDSLAFNFDGQWQYDAAYDLHSGFSNQARDEYRTRLWIDEGYLGWRWAGYDLSFGYQKVVWGQADDIRVVDIINPLNLKDFVLFDIDDYRISLPMLRVGKTIGNWDLEGILILDGEPNQFPPKGSEFPLAIPGEIPKYDSHSTEFGLQAKTFLLDTDIAFYAFHGRNDTPILTTSATGLSFEYAQENMLAGSLSRPIGDFVFRGELAWFKNREFNSLDLVRKNSDVYQWLVGIDYLYRDWLLTAQVTDRMIKDWDSRYAVEESEPLYTLSADAILASGKVTVRFAVSQADYAGNGRLYQSKFAYRPNDNWEWRLNLDVLSGNSSNFFGQFSDRDRLWVSANYLF